MVDYLLVRVNIVIVRKHTQGSDIMANLTNEMLDAVNAYMEVCKKDYFNWTSQCAFAKKSGDGKLSNINEEMIATYNDNITFKAGSKYIKIFTDRSVHGFIVNTDKDARFAKGDILKAAGYNAPARNFARGNALDGVFNNMQWTGA